MTVQRWLLLAAFVVALLAGVTTLPQRSRASAVEPKWRLSEYTELGWLPYVSPKGYSALPQSREACMIDLASVRNLFPGLRLECRRMR